MLEKLKEASNRTIGTKQTLKAIEDGCVAVVFLARDADSSIRNKIEAACQSKQVMIHEVQSMSLLGEACGIQVGAASAALLNIV